MQKKALIIGSEGQDGQLLAKLLYKKNYKLFSIINKNIVKNDSYKITKKKVNIFDEKKLKKYFQSKKFDEIYFLPIKNINPEEKVNNSIDEYNFQLNTLGLTNVLENIKLIKSVKFFYASSSYIYENAQISINEKNKFSPQNFYGLSKLLGMQICDYYRVKYSLFLNVGILFSHTSSLSGKKYLIYKIVYQFVRQKNKKLIIIKVGNSKQKIQLLAAEDVVNAMHSSMKLARSDNFIISGEKIYNIKQLIIEIGKLIAPSAKINIIENKKILKNNKDGKSLIGDSKKIRQKCNWVEQIKFKDLIHEMVKLHDH